MKNLLLIVVALFSFLTTSCEKEENNNESQLQAQIENLLVVLEGQSELLILSTSDGETLEVNKGSELGLTIPSHWQTAIVCNGTSPVPFARCVGSWLNEHPGQCVRVWIEHNGTYCASDQCQE